MAAEPDQPYDSRPDTEAHIARVQELMGQVITDLQQRAEVHDASKLEEPEKAAFDHATPLLGQVEYSDTEAYEAAKAELGDALAHHYEANRHHPEHFTQGVHEMTLLDQLEMLADWKAAGERHPSGGDLEQSIIQNAGRFGYGLDVRDLLMRTARELGWLRESENASQDEAVEEIARLERERAEAVRSAEQEAEAERARAEAEAAGGDAG